MSGWIADYRKELESNIWLMPPMYHRVWQWIKYSVNHEEAKIPNKSGGVTTIKPGQRATSYRQIAKGVGYYESVHKWCEPNPKTVKAILDWMVAQGMIVIEGNSDGTVITVLNWDLYQKKQDKGNAKETVKKHSLDTNNNDLTMNDNEKQTTKDTKAFSDEFNQLFSLFKKQTAKQDAFKNYTKLLKIYSHEQLLTATQRFSVSDKNKGEFAYQANNFFGQKAYYKDYLDGSLKDASQQPKSELEQMYGGLMRKKEDEYGIT